MNRDRRAELHAWIEQTKQLQRKMTYAFATLGVVAFAVLFLHRTAGTFALIIIALMALASFWVTAAHNAAHRQKLTELERNGGKPLQTAHRRWHSS